MNKRDEVAAKALRSVRKFFGAVFLFVAFSGVAWGRIPINEAPEIDPSALTSALTLLVGGVLLLTSRRSRRLN